MIHHGRDQQDISRSTKSQGNNGITSQAVACLQPDLDPTAYDHPKWNTTFNLQADQPILCSILDGKTKKLLTKTPRDSCEIFKTWTTHQREQPCHLLVVWRVLRQMGRWLPRKYALWVVLKANGIIITTTMAATMPSRVMHGSTTRHTTTAEMQQKGILNQWMTEYTHYALPAAQHKTRKQTGSGPLLLLLASTQCSTTWTKPTYALIMPKALMAQRKITTVAAHYTCMPMQLGTARLLRR